MAKSKSSAHVKSDYSKIKNPVKPGWMRIVKIMSIVFVSILLLLTILGIMIKYYRLVLKH